MKIYFCEQHKKFSDQVRSTDGAENDQHGGEG